MGATHSKPRSDIALADQDAKILELKRQDLSFDQIGRLLSISRAAAHRGFHRALPRITEPAAEAYRAEHLARLAFAREIVMDVLATRHVTISNGHVVSEIVGRDDDGLPIYGEPYEDDGVILSAIDRLDKLDDREARLLKLYPKTEVDVSGEVTYRLHGVEPGELA
jgi:hypothetical protein